MNATPLPDFIRPLGDSFIARPGWNRLPDYDPVTSAHLWCVTPVFAVNPSKAMHGGGTSAVLDHENLLMISPVFCFHCEQPWTQQLDGDPCDGPGEQGQQP